MHPHTENTLISLRLEYDKQRDALIALQIQRDVLLNTLRDVETLLGRPKRSATDVYAMWTRVRAAIAKAT